MTERERRSGPDFLIIGAQRSGTTSLYEHLAAHPRIRHARKKEIHYFDLQYWRGDDWYRKQLRVPRLRRNLLTGEASPYYLFHPAVPDRALGTAPDAKLIVILRDPVERALSHYRRVQLLDCEWLSFDEAIEAEAERTGPHEEKLMDPHYASLAHQHFSYVARGFYLDQILAWQERFPSPRFHILLTDDMQDSPDEASRRILEFLEIEVLPLPVPRLNASGDDLTMSDSTRELLTSIYRPHNDRLAAFLGRDLPWGS